MTKKFYSAVAAGTALIAVTMGATSANAASASANANAKIVSSLNVTKTSDLNFGTIIPATTAASVAIAPNGTVTCATALVCSGTTSAASWNVNGASGETVSVSGAPTTLSLAGPAGASMTVNGFTFNNATNLAMTGANVPLQLGATLQVAANQTSGSYTGSFTFSVNYN